jgi:hypothetical protein
VIKLLSTILLVYVATVFSAPGSGRGSFGSDEKATAKAWSTAENVRIDEPVFDYVSEGFRRHAGELDTLGSDHKWEGKNYTVGQTLVQYYLCDVRDLKYAAQGSQRPAPWAGDPRSLPGDRPLSALQASFAISMADVERYTVDKFFDDLHHLAGRQIGELKVSSTPSGGIITLDGHRRGLTFRVSAESAGDHPISVEISGGLITCSETITVPAGGSISYQCPKN